MLKLRACKTHRKMLNSEGSCELCEKKVPESSSYRDFNVKLYVEAEGSVCTIKAWASHFDDKISKAEDLDGAFETLSGLTVEIDCDGEMVSREDSQLEAVRIVI